MPSNCRYHCTTCDEHFASLTAFDLHRKTVSESPDYRRVCLPVERYPAGLEATDSECRLADPPKREAARVWRTVMSEAEAERLAALRS